jgi:hypothetical protein
MCFVVALETKLVSAIVTLYDRRVAGRIRLVESDGALAPRGGAPAHRVVFPHEVLRDEAQVLFKDSRGN